MFSLLLNIYAKWDLEIFSPYLHGSLGTKVAEGEWRGGREARKCHRCSSTCCKTQVLAFGLQPREEVHAFIATGNK